MAESMEPTQPTQVDDDPVESPSADPNDHLWGFLQPCSSQLTRIEFWRLNPDQSIGRHRTHNQIVLNGAKISNIHAQIKWDGCVGREGMVTIKDTSSNGTFINGDRLEKGSFIILRDGMEVGFGNPAGSCPAPGEDYRYIYRYTATGTPTTGVHRYYEIANELGKGTFATVMKAVNRKTGENVAIKMIHRQLKKKLQHASEAGESTFDGSNDGDATASTKAFRREIAIMEQLDHPNVCGLRETFWDDGAGPKTSYQCYLVLELVAAGDLLDYITAQEGLTELDSKQITFQMCRALKYIHEKGVTHRDLKPENVLLTRHRPPIVKVADFGLAKALDSMTMLKTMCGTPSYLAPEVVSQSTDRPGYDNVVDSWSVGVILFSMLTNASPFLEDSKQELKQRLQTREIDWGCLNDRHVSSECENMVGKLLDTNPLHRLPLVDSLDEPWFDGYELPAHHIIPEDYWKDTERLGPIQRDPTTGEEMPRTSAVHQHEAPPTPVQSGSNARPSRQPDAMDEDVDDDEDEATPPPQRSSPLQHRSHGSQPLVRRADLWRRAQENPEELRISEPDDRMIMNFAMPYHTPAPLKTARKRGADAMAKEQLSDTNDPMDVDQPSPTKGRKLKGHSRAIRVVEDPVQKTGMPRRSTRNKSRRT